MQTHPTIDLYNADCLDHLPMIPDASVDLIVTDLPYGTTRNAWDSIIPLEPLWKQYRRITKPTAAIVLTSQQPFAATLIVSNPREYRYELIWHKTMPTGFLNAKRMPLKSHENILVFYRKLPTYNPQVTFGGRPYRNRLGACSSNYGSININHTAQNDGSRLPRSVLTFPNERGLHPTQKPVALLEYLIRTYSHPDDMVLDTAMGSGSTGIAAMNTGRRFIGIERDAGYFKVAQDRVSDHAASRVAQHLSDHAAKLPSSDAR